MTDKKITELNLKSATYYGAQLQMNHFTEELAELIQAAAEGDPQHIAEEIADVEVMVEQMEYLLSLDTIYIESWATHILLANDIESCIWHLAAPIKSINKLRRVNLATAADPDMSKDEVQIKRQTANHDLETDIGELVSYLTGWPDVIASLPRKSGKSSPTRCNAPATASNLKPAPSAKKLLTTRRLHRPRI